MVSLLPALRDALLGWKIYAGYRNERIYPLKAHRGRPPVVPIGDAPYFHQIRFTFKPARPRLVIVC
jgi:hypothetical protein